MSLQLVARVDIFEGFYKPLISMYGIIAQSRSASLVVKLHVP